MGLLDSIRGINRKNSNDDLNSVKECEEHRWGPEFDSVGGRYKSRKCLNCGKVEPVGRPHP